MQDSRMLVYIAYKYKNRVVLVTRRNMLHMTCTISSLFLLHHYVIKILFSAIKEVLVRVHNIYDAETLSTVLGHLLLRGWFWFLVDCHLFDAIEIIPWQDVRIAETVHDVETWRDQCGNLSEPQATYSELKDS